MLYVDNGRVLTSAGAAAGFDLAVVSLHTLQSLVRFVFGHRQRHRKRAAFARFALHSDAASVQTHELAGQIESQPDSLFRGGIPPMDLV